MQCLPLQTVNTVIQPQLLPPQTAVGSPRESYSALSNRILVFLSLRKTEWPVAIWGGKHSFQVIGNRPSLREAGAGTQGRSLDPKPWRTPDYGLASRLPFSYLSYVTQDHFPRDSTTPSGMRPLTTIRNQLKMPHRHSHKLMWWRQFLS